MITQPVSTAPMPQEMPQELRRADAARRPVMTRTEFAREFQRVSRSLWCIAAAMTSDRSGADDLVQQAAVTALEHLDRFDPATNFTAWLGRIVRHAAMNELRRRRRRRTASTDPLELDEVERLPAGRSERPAVSRFGEPIDAAAHFDDRLLGALATLAPTARACLLLRVVLDLPYREISRLLEIPEGTAMSHVDRSRRRLRELLEERPQAPGFGGERAPSAAPRDVAEVRSGRDVAGCAEMQHVAAVPSCGERAGRSQEELRQSPPGATGSGRES